MVAGLWIPVCGFLTSLLVSHCGPWSLDQNHLERIVVVSVDSLPLGEALPYPRFLTALLGQVWVLALLVQSDSTHIPRSGSFYLRGDRESELVVDVIPGFLSGTA